MAGEGIRQLGAGEVVIPAILWQRVEIMLSRFTELEEVFTRLDDLEASQVTNSDYLTRHQAMDFLHVGSTKLWELKTSGKIETSDSTGKTLYNTDSCKRFLLAGGFSKVDIQARFREILGKQQKR